MEGETPGFTPPKDSTPETPSPAGATPPVSGKSPFGSRNTIIAIVLIVVVAIGGFAYWNQKQNEKELDELLEFLDTFEDDWAFDDDDWDFDDDWDSEDGLRDSYLVEESTTAGYDHFTDLEYWFEIDYPTGWILDVDDSIVPVTFMSPYEGDADYFSENVNVTTEDVSWYGELTLDEYGEASLDQIDLALPGYEVLEITDGMLGEHEAQYILGKYEMGAYDTRILSVFALDWGTAYVVTYTYEAGKAALYQDVVDHMLGSFVIW